MFCVSCGNKLRDGATFCGNCGTSVGGGVPEQAPMAHSTQQGYQAQPLQSVLPAYSTQPMYPAQSAYPVQPIYAAPQAHTTMVRDFRCNGCGTPLKIPTNSNAPVRCPSCRTECLIERAIQNAEIAAKMDINSGVPLSATTEKLHDIVVSVLSKSPAMPFDVFDKVTIIREEHYCAPAYIFHCNGTESFTFDVGHKRSQDVARDDGEYTWVETRTRTEYSTSSSNASVRADIIVSGNKSKDMVKIIKRLYEKIDTNKLVDIEELVYPFDVITEKADMPQATAYSEIVVPIIDAKLKDEIARQISGKTTRNLTYGGSNIQKEVTRIYLGIYRIVFTYESKEYSVWVRGDGSKWWWNEGIPEDAQRKQQIEAIEQAKEKALAAVEEPKTGALTVFLFLGILAAIPTFGVSVIISIICGIVRYKKKKEYSEKLTSINSKHKDGVDAFEGQTEAVVQQFKSSNKKLRGIYGGGINNAQDAIASKSTSSIAEQTTYQNMNTSSTISQKNQASQVSQTPQQSSNIPEGFKFDKNTGFYYKSKSGIDAATGANGRLITWFDPNTGKYTEHFYPS